MIINQNKRILCLIDSLASGGAQRQMVGLSSLLKERGYLVKVATYYDIPFYYQQLQDNGVDFEYVPCGTGLLERLSRIRQVIKRFDPDVVISYLDTPNILASLLHVLNRKRWRLIVSERNTTQSLSRRERIKFFLYRFADYIVPNSYSQKDFIAHFCPRCSDKCHVITNFVDTNAFVPLENATGSDRMTIIGVGRVLKQKNIPMLIEAVRMVRERGKVVHVDWYGEKFDSYDECMTLIKQYNLEDSFEFHDASKNIVEKYQQACLFVLPSIFEGFPNVLCEAMACGLPVIATDVCDNGRIVQHEGNGYIVPSNDALALSHRLLQFIELPLSQRIAMGEKSRDLALEMFSKDAFIKKYLKLIQ